MSPVYVLPCLIALVMGGIRLARLTRSPWHHQADLPLLWMVNYAVANVYFAWCWWEAVQWAGGLRTISLLLVIGLTVGQIMTALRSRRSGSEVLGGYVALISAIVVNIPVIFVVVSQARPIQSIW